MLIEKDLTSMFEEKSLNIFPASIKNVDNTININFDSIKSMMSFMERNKISNIFYEYECVDKDFFIIEDEAVLESYDNATLNSIKGDIKDYNNLLEDLDFSKPIELKLFLIHDNILYSYEEDDEWLLEAGVLLANDKIKELIEKRNGLDDPIDKEKYIEELEEELRDILWNDDKFKICTNMSLRGAYAEKLRKKEWFKKYKVCFMSGTMFLPRYVNEFIETTWRLQNIKNN